MKVVGEIQHARCKVTLFMWNQKYLVKIEQGPCEQTLKIPELDFPGTPLELKARITEEFLAPILARFEAMNGDIDRLLA